MPVRNSSVPLRCFDQSYETNRSLTRADGCRNNFLSAGKLRTAGTTRFSEVQVCKNARAVQFLSTWADSPSKSRVLKSSARADHSSRGPPPTTLGISPAGSRFPPRHAKTARAGDPGFAHARKMAQLGVRGVGSSNLPVPTIPLITRYFPGSSSIPTITQNLWADGGNLPSASFRVSHGPDTASK